MNKYTIYFEIFGKKMKAECSAENEEKAKQKIFDRVIFHKIEKQPDPFEDITDEEFQAAMKFWKKILS